MEEEEEVRGQFIVFEWTEPPIYEQRAIIGSWSVQILAGRPTG